MDAPILGHGSWARDYGGYFQAEKALAYELNYSEEDNSLGNTQENNVIPTHSFLMGALVWSGIMGGLFWCLTAGIVVREYFRTSKMLPYFFHLSVLSFVWNLFFSPFGAGQRWSTSLFLGLFFLYTSRLAKAPVVSISGGSQIDLRPAPLTTLPR